MHTCEFTTHCQPLGRILNFHSSPHTLWIKGLPFRHQQSINHVVNQSAPRVNGVEKGNFLFSFPPKQKFRTNRGNGRKCTGIANMKPLQIVEHGQVLNPSHTHDLTAIGRWVGGRDFIYHILERREGQRARW